MPYDVPGPIEKTRTYDYTVAPFDAEAAMTMTGLEFMQGLVAGDFGAKPSISETLGMSVPFDLAYGEASIEADPADFLLNPMGGVHGGFAATLIDSVTGIATHTALPAGMGYATAELKVNMTRAILPTAGTLRATGKIIHVGRQMATSEGRLVGVEDGKLYAHGSATCFLFPWKRGLGGGFWARRFSRGRSRPCRSISVPSSPSAPRRRRRAGTGARCAV